MQIIKKNNHLGLMHCINFTRSILPGSAFIRHYRVDNPGVYIVIDKNYNPVYVGEAKNIYRRLKRPDHPLKKRIQGFTFDDYFVYSIVYYLDESRFRAETILIAALKPLHNDIRYLHGKVNKYKK